MVNPNTMQKALSDLERTGLIYTNRTSGRFITSDETMIKKLKEESAIELVNEFLEKMRQHGFEAEETLTYVANLVKSNKKATN
jgi:DNA-binding transcriptional regulator YhcF (GntR family)